MTTRRPSKPLTLALALVAPPLVAAILGGLTPLLDPGPSGEWALLGDLIFTVFFAVVGAVAGLALAFLTPSTPRWKRTVALLLFPMLDGILTPAAAALAGSLWLDSVRRYLDDLLFTALVAGAGASVFLSLIALLIRAILPPSSRRPPEGCTPH